MKTPLETACVQLTLLPPSHPYRMQVSSSGELPGSSQEAEEGTAGGAEQGGEAAAERELERVLGKEQFRQMKVVGQFNRGFIVTRCGLSAALCACAVAVLCTWAGLCALERFGLLHAWLACDALVVVAGACALQGPVPCRGLCPAWCSGHRGAVLEGCSTCDARVLHLRLPATPMLRAPATDAVATLLGDAAGWGRTCLSLTSTQRMRSVPLSTCR